VVFTADNYDFNVRCNAATEFLSQRCTCESPAHDDDSNGFHSRNLLYLLYCLRTRSLQHLPHSSHHGAVQPGSSHSDDFQVLEHIGADRGCPAQCAKSETVIGGSASTSAGRRDRVTPR
jgi:hypothetical protein